MAKQQAAGGTAGATGQVFVRPVTAEELAAAEAAFPFLRFDGAMGQWVARELARGVKPVDILTALSSGRVPGMQGES